MSKKPLIGITLDSLETGDYATFPFYGVRQKYCDRVVEEGGIPFPLTHDLGLVREYVSLIDGLLITGGGHDISPTYYGVEKIHPTVTLKPQRTAFELAIAKAVLEKNIPLLGICGGEQVINVALGGSLIQHIPDEVPDPLDHLQPQRRNELIHTITVKKGTLLHKIVEKDEISVNSVHHQAVKTPGQGIMVNALAADGVIEGIEAPAYRFCLGLQWHPEFAITSQDKALFMAFLEAARG
ncbi:MAG: gamma-glutamyl-gamma-aminobutyrate hydrolase family protein [Proteobacteria bacterium]|nr:gamma-glutamyl-gamma-aminobutyrate hydrolase family protein [Pseudomonadota bacterium]